MIWMIRQVELVFQSTPPARGATAGRTSHTANNNQFQSTPPARGATTADGKPSVYAMISIHAPREGGDRSVSSK